MDFPSDDASAKHGRNYWQDIGCSVQLNNSFRHQGDIPHVTRTSKLRYYPKACKTQRFSRTPTMRDLWVYITQQTCGSLEKHCSGEYFQRDVSFFNKILQALCLISPCGSHSVVIPKWHQRRGSIKHSFAHQVGTKTAGTQYRDINRRQLLIFIVLQKPLMDHNRYEKSGII